MSDKTSRRGLTWLAIAFVAFSPNPVRGQQPKPAFERGIGIANLIAETLDGIATAAKSAYCTVITVADTWQARDERADLTTLSAKLTIYEADKSKLISHLDRYLAQPKPGDWDNLRNELAQRMSDVAELGVSLRNQTPFLASVPDAGRKLITTLDLKNETLHDLQQSSAPTSPTELKQLKSLRDALAKEVDALKRAHDAISGYIDAKFIQKVGCPA